MTSSQKIKFPIAAFDWGKKRIGVSISFDGRMSFLREHIEITNEEQALDAVSQLIKEERIQAVVLGLPVSLDGAESGMAAWMRDIGKRLQQKTEVAVYFEDERLSTQEAHQKQREGARRGVDSLAAQIILDRYLAKQ